ncbi:hypothetical protein NEMIN01_0920 [Nematocida minor]|uniref:uncharacterized protein n=1 Tax=Nematocida minor TaxID=1912983 RepID=UPI00221FD081|nr:uncharacterized protein NEMIN01_0920 [Nematocida minor]KAI5190221.1 hypothetical protein NEMIN01_0920 [Nematocida minor]
MFPITPFERKLFAQLLEYNRTLGLGMTYRVAGGWVRDRIMSIPCNDIDIAIDRSSGAVFAEGFINYLKDQSEEVHGYHVVAFNHEKAKHLETASLQYLGYSIDFVALRTEEYAGSRIPVVRTGTPQEDANRRDITINSLFYNINTEKVEDYTGKGVSDIEEKKIRTPLDPMETFADDPLRILRVLRFAARLSFEIVPEILSVLGEKSLHTKLGQIVSKERVGQEIKKTLAHAGYKTALLTMAEYGITKVILPFADVSLEDLQKYIEALEKIEENKSHPLHKIKDTDLYLVRAFGLLQNSMGKRKGKILLTEYAAGECFKWTKAERKSLAQIELCLQGMDSVVDKDIEKTDKLVQISRMLGSALEESLTVYDILQHRKAHIKIDVPQMYSDIVGQGYREVYLEKYSIDFETVMKELDIKPREAQQHMERYTQLSIIHKTEDKEYIFSLLKNEIAQEVKK